MVRFRPGPTRKNKELHVHVCAPFYFFLRLCCGYVGDGAIFSDLPPPTPEQSTPLHCASRLAPLVDISAKLAEGAALI